MTSPRTPALQSLSSLDASLPDFQDQVCDILRGEEYTQCVEGLDRDDSTWLVDYLDKVLDGSNSCPSHWKCLHELRRVCGIKKMLPTSYFLSSKLLEIDSTPFDKGGYGDVYKGTLNGLVVCAKRVRVYLNHGPENYIKEFYQEAVVWKRLAHDNVVPFLGITTDPDLQLVSEWMPGGNIQGYIQNHSNQDRLVLLTDIAEGLCYLHSCKVVHGDLKGPNILVDGSGHARIVDFGFAKIARNLDSIPSASVNHGYTPRWSAPEVLTGGSHSKEADVFSFAMVAIEVFTNAVPFENFGGFAAPFEILQNRRPPRPEHVDLVERLWKLIQRCWDQDPKQRPDARTVLDELRRCNPPALKLLIADTLPADERPSLILSTFSDLRGDEASEYLSRDGSQVLVDVIDEVLGKPNNLPQKIRAKCLRTSWSICGLQALLPKSLQIQLFYDPHNDPAVSSGTADTWKGQHLGQDVAVRALRVYKTDDPGQIRKAYCREVVIWRSLSHPNVLPLLGATMSEGRFVTVTKWTNNKSINEFLRKNTDANQLKLLKDIAKGLAYMHEQGIIHGGLQGSDILVDEAGCALVANFSHATLIEDEDSAGNDLEKVGTTAVWAAPEILKGGAFSKQADIFSFAMLMSEVFAGGVPLGHRSVFITTTHIMQGERPPRPSNPYVTRRLWKFIQRCWHQDPHLRPEAVEVLQELRESDPPGWKQLITCTLPMNERIPLMTSTFSDPDDDDVFEYLSKDDSQALIDVIYEGLDKLKNLPQQTRVKCLLASCRICDLHALLPQSLQIPLCYDPSTVPTSRDGVTETWKGWHLGQHVAAVAMVVYQTTNLDLIRKRFCKEVVLWRNLRHQNVLPLLGATMTEYQFVTVSEWMNHGNINEFLRWNSDANRLELLRDAANGLAYMHEQGIIHGDLKGSRVVINSGRHACLMVTSSVRLAPNPSTSTLEWMEGGTAMWMSPELLDPESFGFSSAHPTRESDCYALGTVIYEVLSGQPPFRGNNYAVFTRVLRGERPKRPQGEAGKHFTDGLWGMVERCWRRDPGDRASAEDVLWYLEGVLLQSPPSSPDEDHDVDAEPDSDQQSDSDTTSIDL